ncbi:MAG: DUF1257 domain-containing protein [Treponemataceae bacterium]|nr:DUF1257 domain-containing protein [Treponemataceae bacterium]
MSHISKIETKIKNIQYLIKALKSLSLEYVEAEQNQTLNLQGYGKDEIIENCILEIKTGCKYSLGLRKIGESYEFVADWWAIETFTGQKQEEILNKITRQYAYESVLDKVRDMGYSVVDETQDLHQNLRLTVRRWK